MSSRIRAHIRTNVVGYIALFLVLTGGSAYALNGQNTVFSDDIVNREVKTPDLALQAVTTNRLGANAVKTGRVADSTLTGADVADTSLTGADVAINSLNGAQVDESGVFLGGELNGALTNASLGLNVVDGANVATNTLGGSDIDEASLSGVDADLLNGLGSRARSFHATETTTSTETPIGDLALRPVCIALSGEDNVKLFARSNANGSWITAVAKQDSDSSATTTADDASFNLNDQIEVQTAGDGAGYLMFRSGPSGPPVSVQYSYNEGASSCDVMFVALGGP